MSSLILNEMKLPVWRPYLTKKTEITIGLGTTTYYTDNEIQSIIGGGGVVEYL